MITERQVRLGMANGSIRFITDPNLGSGTVCSIGDGWFYFGGRRAEEMEPMEYLRRTPNDTVVADILGALDGFREEGDVFDDEYMYYEACLKEAFAETLGPDEDEDC